MKPYPLIIASHAFLFCERFVNLSFENWLKHVFLRFYFKYIFFKKQKNTLTKNQSAFKFNIYVTNLFSARRQVR